MPARNYQSQRRTFILDLDLILECVFAMTFVIYRKLNHAHESIPKFSAPGCTPLRPSYAPDLRMKALRAAGVHKSQLKRDVMSLIQTEVGCNVMGRLYEWYDCGPHIIVSLPSVLCCLQLN
jgi:hypothetical protein